MPMFCLSQWIFLFIGFFLVAFGQPASIPFFCILAASFGYALVWKVIVELSSPWKRFWLATTWFCGVQLVQLSWFMSHPYSYIYLVHLLLSLAISIPFGFLSILIKPTFLKKPLSLLIIAALWSMIEWSRLFILVGGSFNPVGLALVGNDYSRQMASLVGIYGLSFWVIFVNLLCLFAWIESNKLKKKIYVLVWIAATAFPYLYGIAHIAIHERNIAENPPSNFTALLVQPNFVIEEILNFQHRKDFINYTIDEWRQILLLIKPYLGKQIDLIIMPEFTVPFGSYTFVYPLHDVMRVFDDVFGENSLKALPSPQTLFVSLQQTGNRPKLYANNVYWAQAIANYFNADLIVGLEDVDIDTTAKEPHKYYNSAQYFRHHLEVSPQRYDKRILVPMGEYIPFEWCKTLAAKYGVFSSFHCGTDVKIIECHGLLISPSICYEEIFCHIMREGREAKAELFVNLTSDAWYPSLPSQHLEHSRPRTVENGVPLLRACNTGVTSALDSFGRDIAKLESNTPGALLVEVSRYHYQTLYSKFGELWLIILTFALMIGTCILKLIRKFF